MQEGQWPIKRVSTFRIAWGGTRLIGGHNLSGYRHMDGFGLKREIVRAALAVKEAKAEIEIFPTPLQRQTALTAWAEIVGRTEVVTANPDGIVLWGS